MEEKINRGMIWEEMRHTHTHIQTNVKMAEEINRGNEPECIKAHICFSAIPPPPTYYIE